MGDVFHIAPATVRWGGVAPVLVIAGLIMLAAFGIGGSVLAASIQGARSSTFELSSQGLRLRGDLYGRLIPANQLVAREARVVSIADGPYRPTWRRVGTALPGYRSGWFSLSNGHKALLYVTDPTRVVLIPTTAGYDVLLSVAETDAFLERLHRL